MNTSYLFYFVLFTLGSRHILANRPVGGTAWSKAPREIQHACQATQHEYACETMLSAPGLIKPGASPTEIIQAAFLVSAEHTKTGQGMINDILNAAAGDFNKTRAATTCLENLSICEKRTTAAKSAIARGSLKDARTWASAALASQYGCWSGLKYVNDTPAINSTMSYFETIIIESSSNALSMLGALDALGPNIASWTRPRTERDGFWEPIDKAGKAGDFPKFNFAGLTINANVCKDGSNGCYKTVQAAVDTAPVYLRGGERYVIKIKEGVYDEIVRVPFNKTNVVFLGDGIGKTVITGKLNAGIKGISTYDTATVGVLGDGFMASGITFENTAPPPTHQAVAFRSSSDLSYVENCEFLGYQDTVYAHSLRQFYKSCRIEGNVDFIFGNAAAIFQDCTILIRPRQVDPEKGAKNAVAALGRTDPAQTTGLIFLNCLINGTDDYMKIYHSKPTVHLNYLGRPWKIYSRIIYINCTLGELIAPEGWLAWDGDFALSTLYFGEFGNSGAGADLSKRVPWGSKIPEQHVSTYYFANFVDGGDWVGISS